MYCPQCGKEIANDARVCPDCGTKIPNQKKLTDGGAVSVGEWMISMLITVIPLVGLIMQCVWAFSTETTESKKNWAKASLIWMLIGFGFIIILSVAAGASVIGTLMSMAR